MRQRSARSSRSGVRVLLGVLLAILVVLVVAEVGARFYVGKRVSEEVPGASVSFGASPLIVSALTKEVNHVTLTTPDTLEIVRTEANATAPEVRGTPESTVDIHTLSFENNVFTARDFEATAVLPEDYLVAASQRIAAQQLEGLSQFVTVTNIAARGDVLEVSISDGLATVLLRPEVNGHAVDFVVVDTKVVGFSLPGAASEAVGDALRIAVEDAAGDLTLTDAQVVPGGLQVTATGTNVDLRGLEDRL